MNNFIKILLILTILSKSAFGQVLNGRITDNSGQPVPYATVYIQEIRQGTTSNTMGDYEIRLPPGNYTVSYQSLGFESIQENVVVSAAGTTKNIILPEQIYDIPEVRISRSGEDPALYIMRKAIGLAPYYLNYISYYKADVYLKGNLLLRNIPRIFQKSMRMSSSEDNMTVSAGGRKQERAGTMKEGDSYLMESFNEVEFTAPDKYIQRVKSYNSTFPDQGNEISPMEFIQASFYQPVLADMAISPLSPQAFSYYDFKYQGASLQGDFTVNKIAVMPKRKSQQLFEGTVFIIEDLWCLHSVDLTNQNFAGDIRVRELYLPVEEDIWMPVSHQIDINLKIFGFRADVGYTSSVKYLDVRPNDKLDKPHDISTGFAGSYSYRDTSKSKSAREIERILQKDELSNRDMVRLSKLMDRETTASRPDSTRSLEIKDNTTKIIDEGAGKKDSSYWAAIRPIPLSEIELRSLQKSDSIKSVLSHDVSGRSDTVKSEAGKKGTNFSRSVKYIFSGHTWSDTTGFSFTNGGLIDPENLSFNTVDGFVYGINFRFNKRFDKRNSIAFYPDIRYAFSREKIIWRVNATYNRNGSAPGLFYIRTGNVSRDIGTAGGINPLLNSLTSLILKKNYLKLYESQYVTTGYETNFKNGIGLKISAGFDNRKVLTNNTSFSIFRPDREYWDNTPVNDYLVAGANEKNILRDQKHFEIVTNVTFTPFQRYRMSNGTRIPMGSDWPVFSILWKHGFNKTPYFDEDYKQFDMFRFEVSQNRETGAFSEITWSLRTGGFADNRELSYFDFFHFNSQPLYLNIDNYDDAFMLPAFYSLSTPEFFGEAHLKYTTPYLLLKLLPGLSNTLIRENISFGYLGSRFHPGYFEVGYSLSEIFLIGEAGIYAGFNDLKYNSIGLRFRLRLN
jgi:hypothetical protein